MNVRVARIDSQGRKLNEHGQELIDCKIPVCKNLTTMTGTRLCDRCYELDSRISQDPIIAEYILTTYKK